MPEYSELEVLNRQANEMTTYILLYFTNVNVLDFLIKLFMNLKLLVNLDKLME